MAKHNETNIMSAFHMFLMYIHNRFYILLSSNGITVKRL